MKSEEEIYPGDPSEKFIEEKLKLNQVIANIKKIEEAIPIIHKMYKEQQNHADILLAHKIQMQDFITFNSIETKLSAHKLEMDGSVLKRLKLFQNQVMVLIQNKVDHEEYKKVFKEKVI